SNAIKFTYDGGSIDICLDHHHNNNQLQLQVKDTGIGIKKEDLSRLFVEFQQLDSGTARHFEGTGLGLSLTKKIVELQKGTIEVESEPGKGSTFTIILPLDIQEEAPYGSPYSRRR